MMPRTRGGGKKLSNKRQRANGEGPSAEQAPASPERSGIAARLNEHDWLYFERTIRKLTLTKEKRIIPHVLDGIPAIRDHILNRNWNGFLNLAGYIDLNVVKEFYSTVILKNGYLWAKVNGKIIRITAKSLNELYEITAPERFSRDHATEYEAFLDNSDMIPMMEAALIKPGYQIQASNNSTSILRTDAKILHHIVCSRFMPTKSPRTFYARRLALVYTLLNGHSIDVGKVIFDEMEHLTRNRNLGSLAFPMTVTTICDVNGVEIDYSTPTSTMAFKHGDLSSMYGFDHPKYNEMGDADAQREDPPPTELQTFMTNVNGFMTRVDDFMIDMEAFMYDARARWDAEAEERAMQQQFATWGGVHEDPPADV